MHTILYLLFPPDAERGSVSRCHGDELWNGLETAADELVDEGIPGRKWVEPTQQDNNLLGDRATL